MRASLARPRFPQARLCRQALVESGPIPAIHGVVRWRRKDLAHWIFEEFRISVDETTVGRELRARLPANTAIEIWWQDEARVGQKTMLTRRWARRGSRPTALRDQRTKSAYIFGAICPARGVGAGLVLPRCNTQAMQWHLDEISALVTPGAHAVLIIDRAGWHTTGRLEIPSNITLMFLPPRAPELNPEPLGCSKTYGSSCAITGFPTGYSRPTTISSRCVAKPGTGSSINPGRSCRSDAENGPMLVLVAIIAPSGRKFYPIVPTGLAATQNYRHS